MQQTIEYAKFKERMQEGFHQPSSKLRPKSTEGEIVEVQGGNIMRSTGRKDRHSKICTSKGPRDRRLRLSARTAIQFYDIQDRLGYDRPSKAVDWLIEKARAAIDALAELPTANTVNTSTQQPEKDLEEQSPTHIHGHLWHDGESDFVAGSNSSGYDCQNQQHLNDNPINSLSFFSMAATTPSSSIHYQNYTPELNSRTINQVQDLSLSLQSFQDPILLHHHSSPIPSAEQGLFSASTPLCLDATPTCSSDRQTTEMGWFQRMITWNSNKNPGNGGEGFVFNSLPLPPQPNVSQNQLFSQRGPLQSSNSLSIRASMHLPISAIDHCPLPTLHRSSTSGIEFTSQGFLGFPIPARIYGEEEQNTASNTPSSATSPPSYQI